MAFISNNNFNKIKRLGSNKRKFIYSKKSYSNPFFQHKKTGSLNRGGLTNKLKLAIFAAITAILILVWLLFFSTLFKIQKIQVSGAEGGMSSEVESIAWSIAENRLVGKNNLLLYNKSELAGKLNEKYYLDNLTIKRKFFHALAISLREKQQAAVWREDEQYYYIDGNGNIINQIDPLNLNSASYPLIENLTAVKIDGRKTNISKEAIDYILSLFNEFKEKKHNFEIERFIIDNDVNTVKMAILSGPKIYFNIKASSVEQTAKLDLIIKDKLKNDFKTVKEYIDLRYANNVYIK
ncbi:MAG: hypothetical protein PHF50_04120 [Patescibacteria group bacterium]|nr:hypothetical protein [Patescibacteria group bacterium]